jgi:hypothetical protein
MAPDRHVLAIPEKLQAAFEQAARDDEMDPIRAIFGIRKSSGLISAIRAWLGAPSRYRAFEPGAPDHEWLRREMERLCAAYEAAVGEEHAP